MTLAEVVVKKGANNRDYNFQILDEAGLPRNITTLNSSNGQVRLYIIDRFSRQTVLDRVLTAVNLSEGRVKWTATTADVPAVGFYDAELWLENTAVPSSTYSEPYEEFPLVVMDARTSPTADRSFESWP